jgi:AcrR family transcriptional regulator
MAKTFPTPETAEPATPSEVTPNTSLKSRKQQFVREAIFDAAIGVFFERGFDNTTVDDVARVAGVSRASFFRYFASKDDLLAQNVMKYGAALVEAIKTSPASYSLYRMMRETVVKIAQESVNHPLTRQIIDISMRSNSAMQAHGSRLVEVEISVAAAYAERAHRSIDDLEIRLLAAMTMSAMNVAILAWHRGSFDELSTAVEEVFLRFNRIVCDHE